MPAEGVWSRFKATIVDRPRPPHLAHHERLSRSTVTWADFVDQFIRRMVRYWPGSTRSLVLSLRVGHVMLTTVLLVGLWRVTAMMSWIADGLIATAACLLFAYFFERSEGE